jgi:hypothetical protein
LRFILDPQVADGWFVSAMRVDGEDVMSSGFSPRPGRTSFLEIVISNAGGTLTGMITDAAGKPMPGARAVLLPEPALRQNRMLLKHTVADGRGEFTFDVLRPGDYTLIALPDEDRFTPMMLREFENLEDFERFGYRIRIDANVVHRIDWTVAPVRF